MLTTEERKQYANGFSVFGWFEDENNDNNNEYEED